MRCTCLLTPTLTDVQSTVWRLHHSSTSDRAAVTVEVYLGTVPAPDNPNTAASLPTNTHSGVAPPKELPACEQPNKYPADLHKVILSKQIVQHLTTNAVRACHNNMWQPRTTLLLLVPPLVS
jgi:hypothetical protein